MNEKVIIYPPYTVFTERMKLRCYDPSDAEGLSQAVMESRGHLVPWMPWAKQEPVSLDSRIQLLREFRGSFDLGEDFIYGAWLRDGRKLVGSTGLHPRVGMGGVEIGYWVHVDHVGEGLASEMAGALTRVAFELCKLDRVEIRHDPSNTASAGVPERLGFTCEGQLRRRMYWPDEEPRDVVIWSLLAEDYPRSPNADRQIEAFDLIGRRIPL